MEGSLPWAMYRVLGPQHIPGQTPATFASPQLASREAWEQKGGLSPQRMKCEQEPAYAWPDKDVIARPSCVSGGVEGEGMSQLLEEGWKPGLGHKICLAEEDRRRR